MIDNEELLEQVYGVDRPEPCVHGHFDCATVEGGPCANELYARLLAADPVRCRWFALCTNPATTLEPHPILGAVPICERCAAKVAALG